MAKIKTQYGQPANYNATPATRADGEGGALEVDANGNLKTVSGGTGTGANQVQGTAADNAAAVGNPVLGGAKYFATPQTYADGDVATNPADVNGVPLVSGTGITTSTLTLNVGSPNTAWFDMLNYAWVSVEILTNTTPATLTWQTSGDASQTNTTGMYLQSGSLVPALTTASATLTFSGPRNGRYFRVSSNVAGAGVVTLSITFFTTPSMLPVIQSGSNVVNATNSIGTGIQAVGMVAQLDDTSPTAITENQFGNVRMSSTRKLLVESGSSPTATSLVPYAVRITTNATTTPTAATAYISSIAISTEVLGTTSTITIQDKSGTPLKLVPTLTTVAVGLTTYNFQTPILMTGGIDIVTAGAAAATVDVWISYYQ